MSKYFAIILLLLSSLLFAGVADARLTLGVVGDDDRVRPLADRLARQLNEEVEVKHLADTGTLLTWLERFAMVDLAVLPSEEVAAHPGRHLVLARLGANAEMSLVAAQGVGGDLPRRLGSLLKESSSGLWGPQAMTEEAPGELITAKTEVPLPATRERGIKAQEIVHLPALQTGKAWIPQGDVAARDILAAATLPTDTLVLGVILDPRGPVQTAEQGERLAGYLQRTMQVPVTVRVFTRPENLTEWFRRYRMVDLAILRVETAAAAMAEDYRLLTGLFRTVAPTAGPFSLAVVRLDLDEAVFNSLQAALVDMATQEEGQKLLAEMGILSVRPPGVLLEPLTVSDQTIAAEGLSSPAPATAVAKSAVPLVEAVLPAAPVVELTPVLADEPALTAPESPTDRIILPGTPVVTELNAPAAPPELERPPVSPPLVTAAPPAMSPASQPQEVRLPVIATLPRATHTDKAPPAPELPVLPEVPAVEYIEAPAAVPPTLVAAEPAVTVAAEGPPVAIVVPAEPPRRSPPAPAELVTSESQPMTALPVPSLAESDQEELQRIVEELIPAVSDAVVLTTEPPAEAEGQLPFAKQSDDVRAMLGENTVVAMVAQPEIPEGLRPSGIPVLRPGRIAKRAPAEADERLVQEMPQPLKKSYLQQPPSLLPEQEPEPGIVYVVPFVSVMVPDEVDGRIFDQFVDILNTQGTDLNLQFVILKEGLQRVDPNWLAVRKYVTGEVYAYVEDSGCCSTDLRTKARLTYRRPRQADPAFGFEYPIKRFFDHDLSTLAKERIALADNIAQTLANELLSALKN